MEERTSGWDYYAWCKCGEVYRVPFGSIWFLSNDVCRNCGAYRGNLKVKVARWVATGKLFKPSTWGTGFWETKDDE